MIESDELFLGAHDEVAREADYWSPPNEGGEPMFGTNTNLFSPRSD